MKYLITLLILANLIFSQSGENQSFKLKDGTIINGIVVEENNEAFIIQTKYGTVTVNKNELVQTEYEIKLKTGETFRGTKLSETDTEIQLKTILGVLNIQKSDILDIKESGQVSQADEKKTISTTSQRRPYSLFDLLFGTASGSSVKDVEFALGEERLIDTFFDPTAYVLDDGTLYLSGLSFGFGLSDKLMITSRWVDFFWGNFNIRPKFMLFHKGNWEKESALAIGGHFHTYWQPNKVVWKTGRTKRDSGCEDDNSTCSDSLNYGGYFPIGTTIESASYYDENDHYVQTEETNDLDFMVELFSAYTFSKARKGMRGRVSSTVGAFVQIPANSDVYPYRIFGSVDVDITPQLKMIGEVFYDPFYLDLYQRSNQEGPFSGNYAYKLDENNPIIESDFANVRPIHFDFGFMYAVNEHFRFGIHNQTPIFAFYWKF